MPDLVPMPSITALYAGLLGLMSIVIGFAVGRLRGQSDGVSIGDGGNYAILVGMRRHANFVEWTPMAVILIALLEMNKVPANYIHILGAVLVVARASHAFGMQADGSNGIFRSIGAVGTLLVTLVASITAITTF